jgi:hypothetical protein
MDYTHNSCTVVIVVEVVQVSGMIVHATKERSMNNYESSGSKDHRQQDQILSGR